MAEECVSETSSETKSSIYDRKVGIVAQKAAETKESGVPMILKKGESLENVNRKEEF